MSVHSTQELKGHKKLSNMWQFTFKTEAAQDNSGVLPVYENPIWYVFGAGTRAFQYNVQLYSVVQLERLEDKESLTIISVFIDEV